MVDRSSPEFVERVLAYHDMVNETIAEYGWMAQAVFPTEEGEDNFHFCYTVGRALAGKPELIVTGMSQNAGPLLGFLIDEWEHLDDQQVGVPFRISPNSDGWFVLAPVPDAQRLKLMTMTQAHAGPEFVALQVLWTDDEDRWPWEPGHARMQRMAEEGDTMPVLAGDDWRPSG